MNKTKIKNYQFASIIIVSLIGVFLHFAYKLTDQNKFIAIFSAVNESVWEHLKLIYFPMLLLAIIGLFFFRTKFPNYLCSKTIGIILSISLMIIFFYTYSGIIGKRIPIIDILSYFIIVAIGESLSYLLIINKFTCNKNIALFLLLSLLLSFIIFTYYTPHIALFKDPLTGKYGI